MQKTDTKTAGMFQYQIVCSSCGRALLENNTWSDEPRIGRESKKIAGHNALCPFCSSAFSCCLFGRAAVLSTIKTLSVFPGME